MIKRLETTQKTQDIQKNSSRLFWRDSSAKWRDYGAISIKVARLWRDSDNSTVTPRFPLKKHDPLESRNSSL
jgi:hypothetical protein